MLATIGRAIDPKGRHRIEDTIAINAYIEDIVLDGPDGADPVLRIGFERDD